VARGLARDAGVNPLHSVMRRGILAAAESSSLQGFVQTHGMRLGAARFVAGETLDDAVPVLRQLNGRGFLTNTTVLGEGVSDGAATRAVVDGYRGVLDEIAAERLQTNVALKLTHLGLAFDEELAYANVAELVDHAATQGNFIRIDMEESAYVDPTLRIFRRLRESGRANVGTVLQSYLYRTERDLEALLDLTPNLRLVKGAYLEPPDVAYPNKDDVDAAYARLLVRMLSPGGASFTGIATHDQRLIERAVAFSERDGIRRDRFQFQLLYGVRPKLQQNLVARGQHVLIATPFGPDWYRYLMRRLAERPANLMFFARSVVRR
jgi:proline dehydrogenase